MRVLVADKISPQSLVDLQDLGLIVDYQPELKAEAIADVASDANVIVVRSTKVLAAVIEAAPQLSLIIRAGAGVNTIDLEAASRRGVYVANCPGKNTAAVAELAIGLLIAADRRIVDASLALRDGKWKKKEFGAAHGLNGRALGVLGYGAIGRAVASRARALGMRVVAWSRSLTEEMAAQDHIELAESPRALAAMSDAVTVHLALSDETRHIVDAEFLGALRSDAILINTSRGELVDTAALREAIDEKQLHVGLDVFEDEPAGGDAEFHDIALAELVTGTPHIGASTDEASEAIAAELVRIVQSYIATGRPVNTVNMCRRTSSTHHLVIRHFNHVGVLASVLDLLRGDGINVEEMENTIFEGGQAACCTLSLDRAASEPLLDRIRNSQDILHVVHEAN